MNSSASGNLRVGVAKVDITPEDLTNLNPLGGSFTGVHDRIHLRALVLDDGAHEVALLSADLIEAGDMTPVRERIERELGIPFDHIVITATHTHSAPRIGLVSPGALAHGGPPESDTYTAWVYDRMIGALKEARASSQPARFGLGKGTADVNVNRDEYIAGKWAMGVNPDGPSDKTVWVLRFETLTGDPIAVLLNYAVHSTVVLGTEEVSADLAGAATAYVERHLGGGVVALWTLGPVGDQSPRVALGKLRGATDDERVFAYEAMAAQGLMVGAEAVRVAGGIRELTSTVRIGAAERVLACPMKEGVDVMEDMIQEKVDSVDLRLGLVTINEVALAGVSGEVVTDIYRRLQRESPLANTLLISIANDRIGYLADDQSYARNTFEVNGCPIVQGYAESGIVDGLVGMIRGTLR
ncbi:neutral/alkaline non-lysosomal ceramidase N-terminal domain-containing protein [Streptomyces sp. NBC_00038]|uniref:neutral/alkaline non-lysosomal ceramidase N-terminal domain-containing protein n=1 Tax=Streptomyces sp. NBC_00038 TaxID=2903615 RepID=UPI002259E2C1|nr:neutral/alkaline non-lysosomal ceramidase N-terminal domain-containing protein [Streptomyces sp. NBC_00038]MCX5555257.1 neutral/alkaline non-lysosomal ceramidase N-terminal domain-containing protein [Streptomyces sp. NBC_00038]